MFSDDITHVPPGEIIVNREARQRQANLQVGDLIPSIKQRGIMHPLIINRHNVLVAGERRLIAAKSIGLLTVPVRYMENLDEDEAEVVELEENVKRSDLTWQDKAKAILRIHVLMKTKNAATGWAEAQTADHLGYSEDHIYKMTDLGEAIEEGDESIINADTIAAATTIMTRRRSRQRDAAAAMIMELDLDEPAQEGAKEAEQALIDEIMDPATSPERKAHLESALPILRDDPTEPAAAPHAIFPADMHQFFTAFEGPKFNFLHCDLPYGVSLNGQANQDAFEGGGYDSNPHIYWNMCKTIVDNWERVMLPSSHVMFWISMKFYTDTVDYFSRNVPGIRVNPTPLIWHKTDGKGIISDALRGPRNIYEAALLMSTGDRKIVRPVSNVYGAPTAKADAIHTNEKPEPMLRHFFSMFVDKHSRVLDPTCGSGSSIRTSESLGAEASVGLEFNPEFADRAQQKLVQARKLREFSSLVSAAELSPLDTIEEV